MPSLTTLAEPDLIRLAQQGDEVACAELYQRHADAIYRYLYFRVGEATLAEDLTSEVFLEMVRALPRYQQRGAPLGAWLFRIAHDRLVDYLRRAANRPKTSLTDLADSLIDRAPGLETQVETRMRHAQLYAALKGLTDEQQSVILFRFIEGYSLEETALLMQKTIGAIKAMQHRALSTLERTLKNKNHHV